MAIIDDQFRASTPILPVHDVKETADFYREKLGFHVEGIWENPNYASISRGGAAIDFGEGRPDHVGSGVCYIHVSDVEAIHQHLKEAGVEMVGTLESRDYGMRDFRVRDNNGNLLIFGSPR